MNIGYDPYVGTMNQFDVKGIIEEVGRSGYVALNLPLKDNFVNPENEEQLQRLEDLLKVAGLSTPSICVAPFLWTQTFFSFPSIMCTSSFAMLCATS